MDCLEAMREMADNVFDLAIVDPPYGIGNFTQSDRIVRHGNYTWNENTPSEKYFAELKRVARKQIIWGANYYNCFESGGAVVWYKENPHPNMSQCEIASISFGKKVAYVKISHQQIITFENGTQRIHPCQKPVALYKWLLTNYAQKGDTILDTHLGSGSSRIAAYDLGFDFTAFELDKDYYEAQEKRFANHLKQPTLFETLKPQPAQEVLFAEQE